jgi:hypothetical protein
MKTHNPELPIWHSRQIAGNKHYEYRDGEKGASGCHKKIYYFDIEVTGKGVQLYDLRDNPAKYYIFPDVSTAKKVAIASLSDKSLLEPYLDKAWYDATDNFVSVMDNAKKILAELKEEKGCPYCGARKGWPCERNCAEGWPPR